MSNTDPNGSDPFHDFSVPQDADLVSSPKKQGDVPLDDNPIGDGDE